MANGTVGHNSTTPYPYRVRRPMYINPPWGGFSKLDCSTIEKEGTDNERHASWESFRRDVSIAQPFWHRHYSNCGHAKLAKIGPGVCDTDRRIRYRSGPQGYWYWCCSIPFSVLDKLYTHSVRNPRGVGVPFSVLIAKKCTLEPMSNQPHAVNILFFLPFMTQIVRLAQ